MLQQQQGSCRRRSQAWLVPPACLVLAQFSSLLLADQKPPKMLIFPNDGCNLMSCSLHGQFRLARRSKPILLCLRLCAGLPLVAFVVWRCRCPNTVDTKPQASPRKCPAAQFRCMCSRGISRLRVLALLGVRALSSLCCLPWRRHLVRPYCPRDPCNLEHEMSVNSTRNQRPVAAIAAHPRWQDGL